MTRSLKKKQMNWISVKDRLPIHGQSVLCVDYTGEYLVCRTDRINLEFVMAREYVYRFTQISHWMPLPDLPKQ